MSREEVMEGRAPWRSLDELAGTPGFEERLGREFPLHAATWDEGLSRRRFLELSGASLALGGLVACTRQPREKIIPYVKQPEEVLPGRPLWFASSFTLAGYASGLLVESHMGRPTKIEGNPDHPSSLGATTAFAQASVLSLYDPDRSQTISEFGRTRTWNAFLEALGAKIKPIRGLGGEGLRILTGAVTSPTLAGQLKGLLAAMPKAKWHQWEAAGRDRVRAGARLVWDAPVDVRYDFSKADVVVTLDADPFVEGPGALPYARQFARRRRAAATDPAAAAVRFYAVDTFPSTGGVLADHRLALSPRDLPAAAAALAAELGVGSVAKPAGLDGEPAAFVSAAAADLRKAAGRSVVVPGEYAPPGVHALAQAMNLLLGNVGTTVLLTDPVEAAPVDQLASIRDLAADLAGGKVELLVVLGANPVFDAPADLDFASVIQKAAFRVHLGLYNDETAQYCPWVVNEAHPLESWSDGRGHDGTLTIQQPLIDPLYGGKSAHDLLEALAVAGTETPARTAAEIVKASSPLSRLAGFDAIWRKSLHDGLVAGSAFAPKNVPARPDAGARAVEALGVAARSFSPAGAAVNVLLRPDQGLFDGRFANSSWLQELPRPQSKLVWDNAAHLSVRTAKQLGLAPDDVVTISSGDRKIEAAVFVLPGHPDGTVTLHFGYGRTRAGKVGNGTGVDVYPLRTSAALWEIPGAKIEKTGKRYPLVTTQQHFNMEGRNLARHGTLAEYRKNPGFVEEMNEPGYKATSLYPPYEYKTHAWGMAVNLSACTGCNACVVACQSENNIPTVGKDQVSPRPRDAVDPDRPLLRGTAGAPDSPEPARLLHALREGALRGRLPGRGHDAQRGRSQRDDLQPLRRDEVLLQQLPVQGAAVQLLRVQREPEAPRDGAPREPRRDRPDARRHGEVHLLRAADQPGPDRRREGEPAGEGRRDRHRLPAGLPDGGARLRRHQRSGREGDGAEEGAAQLLAPRDAEHRPADDVPREALEPAPGARDTAGGRAREGGARLMSALLERPPLIAPGHTPATVTDKIAATVLDKTPRWWILGFAVSFLILLMFLNAVAYLFLKGVGIWGINIPVGWGFDIINFVWWIGIGHAGTLISAILLLLRQQWRTSINRFAEAMTLFAVACAGMYPILHLGRPQLFYWLLPYPNTMGMWVNFRSPLVWDVFAVSTYATISAVFWFMGLIPDLATLRDRSTHPVGKYVYGALAMGWRGSAKHWHNYETASLLLAGLCTPLVLSVHTIVSWDFSVGIIPGWHATIFPPYFVAGADLRRLRDGHPARRAAPDRLRAAGLHHDAAPEQHGQDPARDRADRRLRLRHGDLHGVVQRQPVRVVHDHEPRHGAVPVPLDRPDRSATPSRRSSSGSSGSGTPSRPSSSSRSSSASGCGSSAS